MKRFVIYYARNFLKKNANHDTTPFKPFVSQNLNKKHICFVHLNKFHHLQIVDVSVFLVLLKRKTTGEHSNDMYSRFTIHNQAVALHVYRESI